VQKLIALANPSERMMRRRRMPVLRLSAIEAMGEARTPAAMAALQKLLEDKDKDVREAAARLYTRARRQTAAMNAAVATDV
jgi:HEAT repeat protein